MLIRPPPHPRHIQKSKPQGKLPTTPVGRAFDGHCVRMEVTSGSQARHEESSPVIHTCPGMKREPALGGKIADRPLVRPISSSIRPKPMARQMRTAVTVLYRCLASRVLRTGSSGHRHCRCLRLMVRPAGGTEIYSRFHSGSRIHRRRIRDLSPARIQRPRPGRTPPATEPVPPPRGKESGVE